MKYIVNYLDKDFQFSTAPFYKHIDGVSKVDGYFVCLSQECRTFADIQRLTIDNCFTLLTNHLHFIYPYSINELVQCYLLLHRNNIEDFNKKEMARKLPDYEEKLSLIISLAEKIYSALINGNTEQQQEHAQILHDCMKVDRAIDDVAQFFNIKVKLTCHAQISEWLDLPKDLRTLDFLKMLLACMQKFVKVGQERMLKMQLESIAISHAQFYAFITVLHNSAVENTNLVERANRYLGYQHFMPIVSRPY